MHPHFALSLKDPGHAVDLVIAADIEIFPRARMGYLGLADEAARERRFTFTPPDLVDA